MLFSEPKISQFNRAEPSVDLRREFQCSSASRKFLNSRRRLSRNPSLTVSVLFSEPKISQFRHKVAQGHRKDAGFSALQRAENFSIRRRGDSARRRRRVSVLFSEPKISQFLFGDPKIVDVEVVSVLFSEPKISQFLLCSGDTRSTPVVSVLFSEPKISQFPTLAPASIHIPDRDDHASSFLSLPGVSL